MTSKKRPKPRPRARPCRTVLDLTVRTKDPVWGGCRVVTACPLSPPLPSLPSSRGCLLVGSARHRRCRASGRQDRGLGPAPVRQARRIPRRLPVGLSSLLRFWGVVRVLGGQVVSSPRLSAGCPIPPRRGGSANDSAQRPKPLRTVGAKVSNSMKGCLPPDGIVSGMAI